MVDRVSRRWVAAGAATVLAVGLAVAGAQQAWADGPVTTWSDLASAFTSGGVVRLGADLTNPDGQNLTIGATPVILNLNGHAVSVDVSNTQGLAGVEVGPDAALTVEDTVGGGSLAAKGGPDGAGIGGDEAPDSQSVAEEMGSLTIRSGTVNATGGVASAAIGTGSQPVVGDDSCPAGEATGAAIRSLVISGGTVTAQARGGAGIGTGGCGGTGGTVTVSGGSVSATGDSGIGASGVHGVGGNVTVSGGTVTAEGYNAGIGGANHGAGGSLTISGGSVSAEGGATGVGAGYFGSGADVSVGAGGSLTACTDYGESTAIGAGREGASFGSLSNAGTVTIQEGCPEIVHSLGNYLAVPTGVTVDNSGTLLVDGALFGTGTIDNSGRIVLGPHGVVYGDGQGPAGVNFLVDDHSYLLSFDTRTGYWSDPASVSVYADSFADDGLALATEPSASHTGVFEGWFTAATGGTQVSDSTDLATALGGSGPIAATLYAHYGPLITRVSPSSGPLTGRERVTITGTGFTGAQRVFFGSSAPAVSFTVDSDTKITAVTPSHVTGAVNVRVTESTGGGTASPLVPADHYVFGPVWPGSGPNSGGTMVTIEGQGFTGATAVSFGGQPATSFTVLSDSRISAVVPAGGAGAVDVAVTSPSATQTFAAAYTYLAAQQITFVSPRVGPMAGGQPIAIIGSGLGQVRKVYFGSGPPTTDFRVDSPAHITVITPAHEAGTVNVRVQGGGSFSALTGADHYTYSG